MVTTMSDSEIFSRSFGLLGPWYLITVRPPFKCLCTLVSLVAMIPLRSKRTYFLISSIQLLMRTKLASQS